jgi:hypothetical protein
MTLSESIRLGAALRPQCFGLPFAYTAPGVLGSCVVGASYEALTGRVDLKIPSGINVYRVVREAFPIAHRPVVCPIEGCGDHGPLLSGATHLQDWHELSREAVATWIAEQEAA